MSSSDKPSLKVLARMREQILATLESGEGDQMEGPSVERLGDAM